MHTRSRCGILGKQRPATSKLWSETSVSYIKDHPRGRVNAQRSTCGVGCGSELWFNSAFCKAFRLADSCSVMGTS
jgi:hypothetical protein